MQALLAEAVQTHQGLGPHKGLEAQLADQELFMELLDEGVVVAAAVEDGQVGRSGLQLFGDIHSALLLETFHRRVLVVVFVELGNVAFPEGDRRNEVLVVVCVFVSGVFVVEVVAVVE